MNWERIILSAPTGIATLLVLAGIAVSVAAAGYRRLGQVLFVTFAAAAVASIAAWFAGAFFGLAIGGKGEGAGVAALVFAFLTSGVIGFATIVTGGAFIYRRRASLLIRAGHSRGLFLIGGMSILIALALEAQHIIAETPIFQSAGRLASQGVADPRGPQSNEAQAELLARGSDAVPEVIGALRRADPANLREFENGLNMGVMIQLDVLGRIGGPDAIAELRTWLTSDYAPDIRASAAQALGEAGDTESAHAIAVLLGEESYEWKKCRVQLLYALRLLKARDELPYVVAAMQFASDEEGRSYQIQQLDAGIQALVAFDTPEAWAAIAEIANANGDARRATVQRTLNALGKTMPQAHAIAVPTLPTE